MRRLSDGERETLWEQRQDSYHAMDEHAETLAWNEYDFAAAWCAKRGLKGACGDPLPELISDRCYDLINDDPEAFGERVRASAYALAMGEIL